MTAPSTVQIQDRINDAARIMASTASCLIDLCEAGEDGVARESLIVLHEALDMAAERLRALSDEVGEGGAS